MFEGAIYHVTFRGNNRQQIFEDLHDRKRMLERIADASDLLRVRIYLYCLMPNHVHLLLETPMGNLNKFMASILTGYTMYFNIRHNRSGHLMQGRYGAQLVSGDDYLLRLSRYIHLNPVRTEYWNEKPTEEKLDFLQRYGWSSYRGYAGHTPPESWIDQAPMINLVPALPGQSPAEKYRTFVEAGLAETDEELAIMMKRRAPAIGPESFLKSISTRQGNGASGRRKGLREQGSTKKPDEILRAVRSVTGFNDEAIRQRFFGISARAALAIAWQKYSGLGHRAIAERLGFKSPAAVSILITKRSKDPAVKEILTRVETTLKDID